MAQLVKNLPANAGNAGSILWSGRSLGEGNGNPLQYFRLGNPMDRGAWQGYGSRDRRRVKHKLETEQLRERQLHQDEAHPDPLGKASR